MFAKALNVLVVIQLGIVLSCFSFTSDPLSASLTTTSSTTWPDTAPTPTETRTDCDDPETGWKLEKLNGKVKSLLEEKIEYSQGDHKKELTRLIAFKPNGDYIRDDQREYYQVRDYEKVAKTTFVFDKNCRVIERRDPKRPWLIEGASRTVFSYTPSGTLTDEATYDSEGHLQWKSVATLDKNEGTIETNNTIQEHPEHFKPKRYDVYRHTKSLFKLDEAGNQIEEISYNWEGKLYATYKLAYDSARRLIRKLRLDHKNRPIDLVISKFDEIGLLQEEMKYTSNSYSGLDELIPGTLGSGYGLFQYGYRTVYEYDKSNNWVKKTEFDLAAPGRLSQVTYRTLIYY